MADNNTEENNAEENNTKENNAKAISPFLRWQTTTALAKSSESEQLLLNLCNDSKHQTVVLLEPTGSVITSVDIFGLEKYASRGIYDGLHARLAWLCVNETVSSTFSWSKTSFSVTPLTKTFGFSQLPMDAEKKHLLVAWGLPKGVDDEEQYGVDVRGKKHLGVEFNGKVSPSLLAELCIVVKSFSLIDNEGKELIELYK